MLCVFAKPPDSGIVKTRLAETLGQQSASRLAAAFLLDTWRAASRLEWARPILATTQRSPFERQLANLAESEVWLQGAGDLGQRLERILRRALRHAPMALAIGSDTPGLPAGMLDRACDALNSSEAVLGPCEDGGFYVIGLRRCPAGLLRDLPWSSSDTFHRTFRQLSRFGLRPAVLPSWFDIDRAPDLERLGQLLRRGETAAPETARALAELSASDQGNASQALAALAGDD